jgi:ABC-type multidrug transport system permease subunit
MTTLADGSVPAFITPTGHCQRVRGNVGNYFLLIFKEMPHFKFMMKDVFAQWLIFLNAGAILPSLLARQGRITCLDLACLS